jgi:hypothetical protein
VTGDPLQSLTQPRDLTSRLDRPTGIGTGFETLPRYLEDSLGTAVVLGGLAGLMLAILASYQQALLPAGLTTLGILAFLLLGAVGLPLLPRFVAIPAAMLALCCAVGVMGWLALPAHSSWRAPWGAGAAVIAVALLFSTPDVVRDLGEERSLAASRHRLQRDLEEVTRSARSRVAARRCARAFVHSNRGVPLLAYWLEIPPGDVQAKRPPARDAGLLVIPRSRHAVHDFLLSNEVPSSTASTAPPGFRRVAENSSWVLLERGCSSG